VSNYLHILIGYKPHQLIPDLIQDVKGSSSKWVNEKPFVNRKFSWQEGLGAFSYSHLQVDRVVKYINNQEEQQRKKRFREEYELLLKISAAHISNMCCRFSLSFV